MKTHTFPKQKSRTWCVGRKDWYDRHTTHQAPRGNWLLLSLLLLILTACAGNASAEPTPPTIHYGEDVCEFCSMIINEERHAAAYLTKDGQGHIFDEVGNMLLGLLKNQASSEVTAFFVHDYQKQNWLRAETAYYVLSPEIATPMGSGLVALASAEQAKTLAAEVQGKIFTFEEIVAYYQENPQIVNKGDHELHNH
jgi:copper chaperone NosL